MVETSEPTFTGVIPGTASSKKEVIDSSHSFFLHPSDYPGMNLASSVFDGKSYGTWRRAVVIALSAKNKLGFIDGTLSIPDENSGLQGSWARCNDMVLSWLLNSLSKKIAESVLYSHSAKDLWNDLEDRFGQINAAKLCQLQKELSVVVQENSSVSSYFTKMKSLWDELDTLINFSTCSCEYVYGENGRNLKTRQDQRLLQFLMGLNNTYIGVKSNILLSSPLPSIGQAYSMVIQDEKQREIHASLVYLGDSALFIATQQGSGAKRFNIRDSKGKKIEYEGKKNNMCSYFKKPGHVIGECYRLIGFPPDFKFTNQKKYQGTIQGNNIFTSEENGEHDPGIKSLTQENISQLLQLLQQVQMRKQGASSSESNVNVNCAGPFNEEASGDW